MNEETEKELLGLHKKAADIRSRYARETNLNEREALKSRYGAIERRINQILALRERRLPNEFSAQDETQSNRIVEARSRSPVALTVVGVLVGLVIAVAPIAYLLGRYSRSTSIEIPPIIAEKVRTELQATAMRIEMESRPLKLNVKGVEVVHDRDISGEKTERLVLVADCEIIAQNGYQTVNFLQVVLRDNNGAEYALNILVPYNYVNFFYGIDKEVLDRKGFLFGNGNAMDQRTSVHLRNGASASGLCFFLIPEKARFSNGKIVIHKDDYGDKTSVIAEATLPWNLGF